MTKDLSYEKEQDWSDEGDLGVDQDEDEGR
jgi:hypothetical protein